MLALNQDLFGDTLPFINEIEITDKKPVLKKRSYELKIEKTVKERQARASQSGFFEERDARLYMSGCSGYEDLLGYLSANKHVCVNTKDMNSRALGLLKSHLCRKDGSNVFVDSGAFRVADSDEELDFDDVFDFYFDLAFSIPHANKLIVCAPDIVRDQSGSIALQMQYKDKLLALIDAGVNVMFPIQKGDKEISEVYTLLCKIFGEHRIIIGLPAATAAIPHDELIEFLIQTKPKAVHLLGANKNKKIVKRALYASPGTIISCDSNRTNAYVGQGCALTELHADLLEESVSFCQELSENYRGEICGEIPQALNHPLTKSLDLHMDYTEFDELSFISELTELQLSALCVKLKGYLDDEHLTPEYLLGIPESYLSMFECLEEVYTDDFASMVVPMFWDFYCELVKENLDNAQFVRSNISPKCRTRSITELAMSDVFD
jgi:hypothetical protein